MGRNHVGFLAAALLLAGGAPAHAEDPVSLGAFDDWEAFSYHSDGAPVCYVFSVPKTTNSDKKIAKRDSVYFMVTNFPGRKAKGQISTIIGYPFQDQSTVQLLVDEESYELYTSGDRAWAADPTTEATIVKQMKTAKTLTVSGTSSKGTTTTDTYSLTGFPKALDKIDTACK
jgi:hypothetical protein